MFTIFHQFPLKKQWLSIFFTRCDWTERWLQTGQRTWVNDGFVSAGSIATLQLLVFWRFKNLKNAHKVWLDENNVVIYNISANQTFHWETTVELLFEWCEEFTLKDIINTRSRLDWCIWKADIIHFFFSSIALFS